MPVHSGMMPPSLPCTPAGPPHLLRSQVLLLVQRPCNRGAGTLCNELLPGAVVAARGMGGKTGWGCWARAGWPLRGARALEQRLVLSRGVRASPPPHLQSTPLPGPPPPSPPQPPPSPPPTVTFCERPCAFVVCDPVADQPPPLRRQCWHRHTPAPAAPCALQMAPRQRQSARH